MGPTKNLSKRGAPSSQMGEKLGLGQTGPPGKGEKGFKNFPPGKA